jgi:CubicO group peptidase (beta-lactamase class C family)
MPFRTVLAGLLFTVAAPTAFAQANCITFEGRHGGVSGEVVLDLDQSQVRIGTGWWASITRRPEFGEEARPGRITLQPGDRFREPFDPRQGCDARRRYRFHLEHDGRTFLYEYPSATGFTTDRVVDLGGVSRFFGIPPAADPEPPPVTVEGLELGGEWVRTESTYDPNDGMRVEFGNGRATITSRPEGANAAFTVGAVIWRDVEPDGSLRVLGSDNNYYPARIEAAGAGRIALQVQHGGAGSTQTWSRAASCWSDDRLAGGPSAPDIWVRFTTDLPAGLQAALRAARDADALIQTAAITEDDEWVVVAGNEPCYSAGFPAPAREWIDDYIAAGKEIDVVAFGPGGRWIVVAEDLVRRTTNVSDAVVDEIRRAYGQGRRLTSFAFSPDPDGGWFFTAGGEAYAGDDRDAELWAAVAGARAGLRPIHEISIANDGSWVMVAEDWFVTSGQPAGLREWLENYRTEEERRIDHVVLAPGGGSRWAIVSNGPEPDPDPADIVNLIEHGLTGDSTIYQRMQFWGVVGLTVALVQDNEVSWVRSYGVRESDVPETYVLPNAIFDAASISKPVSGVMALQLVDDGALSLTQPGELLDLVGEELPSGPAMNAISPGQITLAHLLNHCAAIDNEKGRSGAQAVVPGDPMPTLAQMFLGQSPGVPDNRVVPIDTIAIGERFDYSDANSLLIQALIERHAEGGFNGQAERLLDALDMRLSTYDNDFWETTRRERFAFGHDVDTFRVVSKTAVRLYPNQVAAGLRTTARDLAQFVIMLNQDGEYDGERIIEAATVDRYLGRDGGGSPPGISQSACTTRGDMRLSINARRAAATIDDRFYHGGLHNGYRTRMWALPNRRAGLVILSTGGFTGTFMDELDRSASAALGWPSLP